MIAVRWMVYLPVPAVQHSRNHHSQIHIPNEPMTEKQYITSIFEISTKDNRTKSTKLVASDFFCAIPQMMRNKMTKPMRTPRQINL